MARRPPHKKIRHHHAPAHPARERRTMSDVQHDVLRVVCRMCFNREAGWAEGLKELGLSQEVTQYLGLAIEHRRAVAYDAEDLHGMVEEYVQEDFEQAERELKEKELEELEKADRAFAEEIWRREVCAADEKLARALAGDCAQREDHVRRRRTVCWYPGPLVSPN
eukprot:Sspe_Gene.87472::Locus_58754_Transcript_1_4_Confidence_0.400_Length_625::g.87472::m.87472